MKLCTLAQFFGAYEGSGGASRSGARLLRSTAVAVVDLSEWPSGASEQSDAAQRRRRWDAIIVAHDLGTTGNKASLHEDDGTLVDAVTVRYPTDYGPGGVAEQAPHHWWRAVADATRALLGRHELGRHGLRGIVVGGQMMGAVLLDSSYQPVRPALIWADRRSVPQAASLAGAYGEAEAYRLLGHRLNPTYSLPKVMWVRDNEPDIFRTARHFCLAKDFVVHRMTGRLATDKSDASGTNAYAQRAGSWSESLLDQAHIAPELFPEILSSTEVVGEVLPAAAADIGVPAGTAVVMGGGDGPLAAVGAGVVAPGDRGYTYLGSSSWISLVSDEPLLDPQMRTMTFDNVIPGTYVPTATMQAGGGSVWWARSTMGLDSTDAFRHALDEAAEVDAAAEGLFFLPHLLGERSPYWNADAAGAFVGLGMHHRPAHLLKAVLEGVAFNLLTCVAAFRDAGHSLDQIDAIGGGAASDVWLQILADTWGCAVRRRSVVEESNSLGAAVTAAVGLGLVSDFSIARELSHVTAAFQPDEKRHQVYREQHARFLEAYGSLEQWCAHRKPAAARGRS